MHIRTVCVCFLSTDIDECSTGLALCNDSANCTDTDGSYECTCFVGYSGDGFTCESEL